LIIWSRPQSAARNGNLKAVNLVVKISREFDRCYGLAMSVSAAAPEFAPLSPPPALPPPRP